MTGQLAGPGRRRFQPIPAHGGLIDDGDFVPLLHPDTEVPAGAIGIRLSDLAAEPATAIGKCIFDPGYFTFGQDMALGARMRREGWQRLYSGHQIILHHHGQSFRKQSSIDLLATIHRGPRSFFRATHGPGATLTYDVILLVGYLLRWWIAAVPSVFRPDSGYGDMARFGRAYVGLILRSYWPR